MGSVAVRRRRRRPAPTKPSQSSETPADRPVEKGTETQADEPGETKAQEVDRLQEAIVRYRERGFDSRSPVAMARAFCIECMGGYIEEVGRCTRDMESENPCPIYPLRMGKNTLSARAGKSNPNAFKAKRGGKKE